MSRRTLTLSPWLTFSLFKNEDTLDRQEEQCISTENSAGSQPGYTFTKHIHQSPQFIHLHNSFQNQNSNMLSGTNTTSFLT